MKEKLQKIKEELEIIQYDLSIENDGNSISMAEYYIGEAIEELEEKLTLINDFI